MKPYWMPLGCLRVGPREGTVPQPGGELSGGGCDLLKRSEGASGVNASLESQHSCTGCFCRCWVLQLWLVLLKEFTWSCLGNVYGPSISM